MKSLKIREDSWIINISAGMKTTKRSMQMNPSVPPTNVRKYPFLSLFVPSIAFFVIFGGNWTNSPLKNLFSAFQEYKYSIILAKPSPSANSRTEIRNLKILPKTLKGSVEGR